MAKGNSEYRMAIKIAGEIEKSLYTSSDMTRKELNKIAREAAKASLMTKDSFGQGLREIEPFFIGMEAVAVKTFKAVATAAALAGTAIIGAGVGAAKVGIEFESAFAGVKKTTDATTEEYAAMQKEIIAMTREIPAAGAEIAEVAEAAGQLGIKKENLMEFSKVMIDLGEATNLTATEGASQLAKFANITQMSADNYDRLGSTVVDLGNNFATTEADIVDMSMRLASSGELAGYSEAQMLAIATAMSSVGIEAEAGGSAMSKLIKNVQVSVETGSKDLKDYAKVANMSVEEFKKAFKEDAVEAVSAFITGLNDIERNGKSATVILDDMGLTEVRLSNTILSLANSGDLMSRAIETANTAWEENTALTKEAEQRYETMESKLGIMKNGFAELGIEAYEQFNGPLGDGVEMITELVHAATEELSSSNVIRDITRAIIDGIPGAVRIAKKMAAAIWELSQPILEIGGWMLDNPKVIAGTLAGIGTAIVSYKVVNGIMGVATAIKALTTASAPILALTGTVAAVTALTVAVKMAAAEAKKASLDKHFGNISLSMEQLDEVATNIVSNDSLGELQESIRAMRELEGIDRSIEQAVDELNQMNWEISIGMDLDEEEKEEYKSNITNYVKNMQDYMEQNQYAVHLAVGALTEDNLEGTNIVLQLDEFYSKKTSELKSLGTRLNETVTDAFQNGFLDIDEAKTIADLQQQMANIKAAMTEGKYEAELDLLGLQTSGKELDPESFVNLQNEINEKMEAARKDYDESFVTSSQALRSRLAEDKTYTQSEYDADMKHIEAAYTEQVGALEAKAVAFMANTVKEAYGVKIDGEIGGVMDGVMEGMPDALDRTKIWSPDGGIDARANYRILSKKADLNSIDPVTRDLMGDFYGYMAPNVEELQKVRQQYIDAGKKVPEYINEGIDQALAIGMIGGNEESVISAMASQSLKQTYQPTAEDEENITASSAAAYEAVKNGWGNQFKEPIDVEALVKLYVNNQVFNPKNPNMKAYGYGGFATEPQYALIAERGYDEALIPMDGTQQSISIWQQAGEQLGVFKRKKGISDYAEEIMDSSGGGITSSEENNKFTFSPVYQFNGEAPRKKDLDDHVKQSFEDWETMMNRWMRNNQRFSFS